MLPPPGRLPHRRAASAQVSAHVTAAQVKFLLLHDGKGEDAVRAFFRDVHELYLRVMMNPFFSPNAHIR